MAIRSAHLEGFSPKDDEVAGQGGDHLLHGERKSRSHQAQCGRQVRWIVKPDGNYAQNQDQADGEPNALVRPELQACVAAAAQQPVCQGRSKHPSKRRTRINASVKRSLLPFSAFTPRSLTPRNSTGWLVSAKRVLFAKRNLRPFGKDCHGSRTLVCGTQSSRRLRLAHPDMPSKDEHVQSASIVIAPTV